MTAPICPRCKLRPLRLKGRGATGPAAYRPICRHCETGPLGRDIPAGVVQLSRLLNWVDTMSQVAARLGLDTEPALDIKLGLIRVDLLERRQGEGA